MVHLARRPSRLFSRTLAAASAGLLALTLLGPVNPAPSEALGVSTVIDALSGYDAQTVCRKKPLPGTVALAKYLQRSYPATGSMGMVRGCGSGGTSEHKDGRAFDWAADVSKPKAKKAAYDFIRKALATDAAGNRFALARRLGIMYLIYNDTMWASYRDFAPRPHLSSGCRSKKKCSRSLRHLNHVHISLGYAGAAAQTSWYRARNVASLPVLFPRTNQLDPEATAVTPLTVPATGQVVTSSYALRAGVTYRLVTTGTVRYAAGQIGDAACTAGAGGWTPTDQLPLPVPLPVLTTHGLLVAGGLRWGTECRADHTYETWFTPLVTQRLALKYVDAKGSDNAGALTVYVARDDIIASSLARR